MLQRDLRRKQRALAETAALRVLKKKFRALCRDELKHWPPSQIGPRLAVQGRYLASVSTLYRLLQLVAQMAHRRLERVPHERSKPCALTATQPDQIYCGDSTCLHTPVRGAYLCRYLFVDLFSRKTVGWQVPGGERAELHSG